MTESEVLRFERNAGETASDKRGEEHIIPRKFLSVINRREPDKRKGLTPDAMLLHGSDRIVIEIDNSKRSAERAADLRALVACVGTSAGTDGGTNLFDGTRLARVVVFTKERRCYIHITGMLRKKSQERIERASTYLKAAANDGVFDVWFRPSIAEDKPGHPAQDRVCGRVQVLMLPDIRGKGEGWYDQDWLPFAQLDEQLWPPQISRGKE